MNDEMLSLGKAADLCAVSRRTLWTYVKSGALNASRTPGGHYRVSKNDLNAFIEKKAMKINNNKKPSALKILVVDDDPGIRKLLTRILSKKGNIVVQAADGFEAGQKTVQVKPDIMIVDIFMPKMNGFDVCLSMKKNPETKETKIIAISGHDTTENRTKILECGADFFLAKPLDVSKLENVIQTLIN